MSSAKTTTDHNFIKEWAEERGGHPSVVKGTHKPGLGGVLRFDFITNVSPPSDNLEHISWDEFFKIFEENHLELLYGPDKDSRFFKFVQQPGTKETEDKYGEEVQKPWLEEHGLMHSYNKDYPK